MTPFFKVFNRKPNLAKVERFGSDMFCTKDKPNCNLETRAEKGKFVGFSDLSGGVLMYLPDEGRIVTKSYSDCLFLEPSVTPTRGSQPVLSDPVTTISNGNPPSPNDSIDIDPDPCEDSRGSPHAEHTSIPAPIAGNSRTLDNDSELNMDNSHDNHSSTADVSPSGDHTRPIRSNRNKLPPHLNDFVCWEDEDLCQFKFKNFRNLDINHVRLNSVRIYDVNTNDKNNENINNNCCNFFV